MMAAAGWQRSATAPGGRFAAAIMVALLVSCAPRLSPEQRALGLVGRWVISDSSLAVIAAQGFPHATTADHLIVLRADGTCDFRGFWDFHTHDVPQEQKQDYIVATSCSWRVKEAPHAFLAPTPVVDFGLRSPGTPPQPGGVPPVGVNPPVERYSGSDAWPRRKDGRDILSFTIGDPDRGRTIDFVREPQ